MAKRNIGVRLSAEVNQFKQDMKVAGDAAVKAANQTETAWDKSNSKFGKMAAGAERYSSEMTTAGASLATFGGVVVGALGLSTKAAISWESAFAGVLKTVDGSPAQLAKLEKGLRGLTKELPASHEEIAAVAEAAGQLGIQTDSILTFTKTMINMGEATNLSAEEAATSLAQFMNVMGTSQSDVGKLGAAIVALGNDGASTEKQIVEMAQRLAGAGAQANMSEADVLGFASALSSVGIDAEAGGSALSMTMKRMGDAVANGGDQLDEFAAVAGMTSEEFATAWGNDSAGTLAQFVTGLDAASDSGENVNGILTDLGITGIRESDALLRLSGASDVLTDSLATANAEYEKGTALAEEAEKRYGTTAAKMQIAANAIKDNAITLGQTFLPLLAKASDALVTFNTAIGNVPDPVLKALAAAGGLVGTLALVGGGALVLVPRIAETVTAFQTLKNTTLASNLAMSKTGTAVSTVSTKMGGLKGIAAGAAAGMTVLALTGPKLTEWGNSATKATGETADALQSLSGQMGQGAIDVDTLNTSFTDLVGTKDGLGEFGNAVNQVIDPNGWGVLDDVVTDTTRVISLGMVDMTSTTEEARARFVTLGEQMATLASTNAPAAQESFQQMVAATDGSKESISNLIDLMPAYKDQLTQQAQAMGLASDNTTLAKIASGELATQAPTTATAIDGVATSADDAASGLQDMLDGMLATGLATLSQRDAMRQYEQSIDDVTDSIAENGTTLDTTTEKGRNNQAALDGIADSGLRAAQSMAENGASQEDLQTQLSRTYDDLVSNAKKFGLNADKADDMAREIMGIPDDVDVDSWMSAEAEKQANDTAAAVDGIDRNVKVTTTFVTQGKVTNFPSQLLAPGANSGGKYVRANALGGILTPMAAGGFTGAEMVKPNTWRVVGDRMDVPEAYVPLDGSKRSWKILLEALASMPGAAPMAAGGVLSAGRRRTTTRSASATSGLGLPTDDAIAAVEGMSDATLTAMQEMQTGVETSMAAQDTAVTTAMTNQQLVTDAAQKATQTSVTTSQTAQQTQVQTSQQAMATQVQTSNSAMLATITGTQEQMRASTAAKQESMRATTAAKQAATRDNVAAQQDAMRSLMATRQEQMRSTSAEKFESMRATSAEKLSSMHGRMNDTMSGMRDDYSGHMTRLKATNKTGFDSMESAAKEAFSGIRSGMSGNMTAARPELGGQLNALIAIFGRFTASVNKAFGDVGVELDAPKAIGGFAAGGTLPGYTPGYDVHRFTSKTAGTLDLSGGESIMVPEFTAAVGGAAGVDHLNDAARRGQLDDEQYWSFAGGGTLTAAAKWWQQHGTRITEFKAWGQRVGRHSPNSLHYSGNAFDANYGPGGTNAIEQAYFDKMIPGFKSEFPKIRVIWRAPGHFSHAHFDTGRGADIGNVPGGGDLVISHPFLDRANIDAGSNTTAAYTKAAKILAGQIVSGTSLGGVNPLMADLATGIMGQASTGLVKKATDYGKTAGDFSSVGNGPVKDMARQMLEKLGWSDQFADLDWILTKESGWNPTAQNPSSTAYGLFQFLNSTWGTVGGHKTSDPRLQLEYGLKYMKQRYGDIRGARDFWARNHWYAMGTRSALPGYAIVGEQGPELLRLRGGEEIHSSARSRQMLSATNQYATTSTGRQQIELSAQATAALASVGDVTASAVATAIDGLPVSLVLDDGRQLSAHISTQISRTARSAERAH